MYACQRARMREDNNFLMKGTKEKKSHEKSV